MLLERVLGEERKMKIPQFEPWLGDEELALLTQERATHLKAWGERQL